MSPAPGVSALPPAGWNRSPAAPRSPPTGRCCPAGFRTRHHLPRWWWGINATPSTPMGVSATPSMLMRLNFGALESPAPLPGPPGWAAPLPGLRQREWRSRFPPGSGVLDKPAFRTVGRPHLGTHTVAWACPGVRAKHFGAVPGESSVFPIREICRLPLGSASGSALNPPTLSDSQVVVREASPAVPPVRWGGSGARFPV